MEIVFSDFESSPVIVCSFTSAVNIWVAEVPLLKT